MSYKEVLDLRKCNVNKKLSEKCTRKFKKFGKNLSRIKTPQKVSSLYSPQNMYCYQKMDYKHFSKTLSISDKGHRN